MTNFTGKNIERKLKILIVGLGGIGSQLTDLVVPASVSYTHLTLPTNSRV